MKKLVKMVLNRIDPKLLQANILSPASNFTNYLILVHIALQKAKLVSEEDIARRKADLVATIEGNYAQESGTLGELNKLSLSTLKILASED